MHGRISFVLLTVLVLASSQISTAVSAQQVMLLGDLNTERWSGTIGGNVVQAYTRIQVSEPIVIQSVSMYLQYAGSDGSQCMMFGVYRDNGAGSPAGEPLVATTRTAYCLHGTSSWGPAWQRWSLLPSDYLQISSPGTYWLCTLAKQTYGYIFHYGWSGSSAYDYRYGYATYYFYWPFNHEFPSVFSNTPTAEYYGPYSFYVAGSTSPHWVQTCPMC